MQTKFLLFAILAITSSIAANAATPAPAPAPKLKLQEIIAIKGPAPAPVPKQAKDTPTQEKPMNGTNGLTVMPISANVPAPSAGTTTVSAVLASLCPEIQAELATTDLSTLSAALKSVGSQAIPTIPNNVGLDLALPVNSAFLALPGLGVDIAGLISNQANLLKVAGQHVMTDTNGVIKTLDGNVATVTGNTLTVANAAKPVGITKTVTCVNSAGQKQTAFVADSVIVPTSLVPAGKAPAPAPKAPAPIAPSSAFSAAPAAAMVVGGVLALMI